MDKENKVDKNNIDRVARKKALKAEALIKQEEVKQNTRKKLKENKVSGCMLCELEAEDNGSFCINHYALYNNWKNRNPKTKDKPSKILVVLFKNLVEQVGEEAVKKVLK